MKFLSVVVGVMFASACSGDSSDTDEVVGVDSATSSLETLRDHGGYGGHDGVKLGSRAARLAIARGASRLASLQADTIGDNARNGLDDPDPDDGGWDFLLPSSATSHSAAASPPNIFGETGLGVWAAVDSRLAGTRALVAALDAGTGMQRNPDIDSAPDLVFGVLLAELADNPGFAGLARERYDAKRAANGGAVGLGTLIRDARHRSNQDGLIAYDLSWFALGTLALDSAFPGAGYDADAETYAGIVVDDLTSAAPRFNPDDPTEGFYVTGLAWSQVATDLVGARAAFRRVRARLLDEQHGNGAWGDSAAHPADDLQSTAYALETLALTDRPTQRTRTASQRAIRFLVRAQATSGGWPDATGVESPLGDGDIVLALALSSTSTGDDGLVPEALAVAPANGDAARLASPSP
jgi:hypothetical protein